ncbi:acyl-CoA thioesterase [Xanthovirga aplysinae]|uniref:acyl-CoA thioesterase n=1 Tax=Xanthovirga aplysinae TaxID=2529853 RepID=UPI0012BC0779|nr:thioesterase family protein [Xanthovirga aplysinae]MTI30742.1 thioesterase [Xanthovirga aplysinae]
MARIKINLPEKFPFQTFIPVRITDLNYGKHVGNDTILSLMHEARVQYFQWLGYKDELNLNGIGLIMADSGIMYKSETFYGEKIIIEVAATELSKVSFDLIYRLSGQNSGKEIARGKTGMVCFDYENRRPASIPETLKENLMKSEV